MRNFLRTPLTWLVIAEFVVVGALIVVAWNAIAGTRPVLASPVLQQPDAGGNAADSQLPELPSITKAQTGPLPGLNLDSDFWRARLIQLNQDQVFIEQLEWRVVHSALAAAERYMQTVVIPSVERAESARS